MCVTDSALRTVGSLGSAGGRAGSATARAVSLGRVSLIQFSQALLEPLFQNAIASPFTGWMEIGIG